ncbi:hypothetical protein [Acetomicrobium sp.]|uniref:hypothetical protein n=1 Tax=Acetomicrobium sp. TaxID=1872099 RepID=UPI0028715C8F|nr:hypothetical protein [Acetomicrobium sp.]MDR9770692.1 hypothetical protein [Acetomicrobium sp.]HPT64487.1 hypothetical protein [Acetomicrobium sp.]
MNTLNNIIPIRTTFKGRFVMVGEIEGDTFKRSCRSDQLYRAMGGSLGVDDEVLKMLEQKGVKKLEVTVKDWDVTYCIDFQRFKRLARPREFYGVIRWHLPFDRYWEKK